MNKPLFVNRFLILFAVGFLMMPFLAKAQEPDWLVRLKQQKWMQKVSKLNILKTTREEAERILGKPDIRGYEKIDFIRDYNIEYGQVTLTYTTKECSSIDGKISKDAIEEISFYPDVDISFSKLKIPVKQFKKWSNGDTPGFHYESERYGFTIYVDSNKVHSIHFEIPKRKKLNCVTNSTFLNDLEKIKKIKLLESNRDEVGKLFVGYEESKKIINSEHTETYFTGDGWFEFTYSEGKCDFDDKDGYESAEWNVESVKISPVNSINPKDYGINLAQYKKEQVYKNVSDLYVYYDKDLGISFQGFDGELNEINFFPAQKYNSLMCHKERAKILSSTESLFTEKLKDRIFDADAPASVDKLHLSQNEIINNCNSSNEIINKNCSDNPQKINVFTRVLNPRNDVLTYSYTVMGGKIIGQGKKVVWDLTGVKAGTYSITSAVDDGCGFCGFPKTRKVVVKECPNCGEN